MAGRKSSVDKELVIDLFKKGLTYRAIAAEVNSTEDAIRMLIKHNAPEELLRKKEAIKLKTQTRNAKKEAKRAKRQLEGAKTSADLDTDYFITDKSKSNVLDVEARIQILNEKRK